MNKPNQAEKTEKNNTIKGNLSTWQWIVVNFEWLWLVPANLGIVLALFWLSDGECSVLNLTTLLFVILLWLFWRLIRILIKKNKSIKQWLLDNRFLSLIFAAIFGVLLGIFWVKWNGCLPPIPSNLKESIGINECNKGSDLDLSLTTLLLVLPTLLVLWLFRTHDTRDNILTNILTHALDMIVDPDLKRRSMGLIQLAQLKKQTNDFDAQIDAATRLLDLSADLSEGASLSTGTPTEFKKSQLMFSSLENMDLRAASLRGANLRGADLRNADLSSAILISASLRGANLSGANLSYAFLSDANLSDAGDLSGAKYNEKTDFPKGFNPEAEGMVKVEYIDIDDKKSED